MAEDQPAEKKHRIHVGLVACVSLSQSEEGSATLRQPVDRNVPGREPHRGLLPRHRTRRKFQPPRRVGDNSVSCSPVSDSSVTPTQNSIECRSNSNTSQHDAGDQFGSDGDDSEMVEQSSEKSIELLSKLGGFTSASAVHTHSHGQPVSSWATSNHFSPSKDRNSAQYFARPQVQRKSRSFSEKDVNQKSITQFMKSSPNTGNLAKGEQQTTVPSTCANVAGGSQQKSSWSGMSHTSPEKIAYGSPSKMYSPIKQVSDHVYVISDEDSPQSSHEKSAPQDRTASIPSTSSFMRKLFDGQKAAKNSGERTRSKRKNSKSASARAKLRKISKGYVEQNGGTEAQKRKLSFLYGSDSGQNGASPSISSMKLDDINFGDSDSEFQSPSNSSSFSSSTPAVRKEVEVGKTFGLLGDSKVRVVSVNYFQQLPLDVIENIFCRLPMLDLCLNMNCVCSAWNDIISSEKFIPWKKLYHRLKLGEASAQQTVEELIQENGMSRPSLRLLNLISYMQSFKRVAKENNVCELLQQHPKYTWAVALLKERLPECFVQQEPNPWSLLCTLVVLAANVEDIRLCLQLLTSARSHLLSTEVLECLYCIATFLLAFSFRTQTRPCVRQVRDGMGHVPIMEAKRTAVVSGIHYRLFYALYLFENASFSSHAMLQEAMAGQSGQQSIVKYSRGETEVRLTHEQMRIIKYTPTYKGDRNAGEVVKIFAFAGSGKTTTLVRYAQMRPNLKFLLIVFNKSICEHAKVKFPGNVVCKTGHGLAFGYMGRKYAAEKQLNPGNQRVYEVLTGLPERERGQKENYYVRAKFVLNTLKNFMASAEENITTAHTPEFIMNDDGLKEFIPHDKRMLYAQDAEHYWNRMKDLKDRLVKMTHDGYLKLYQLSKPKLWGYDIILVDEAQDLTPAVLDIVNRQTQPKIFVGDQHQQIYAFRGAVNAMAGVSADKVFYLTQSFRFGPQVSQVASLILETLKGERRKTLVGHGVPGKISGEQVGQLTILCRTNFHVFAEAVILCVYSDQPVKIAFVGGLDSFGFPMLEDIYTLMMAPSDRLKEKREIQSRFIAGFPNIGELEKYAKKTSDVELAGKIRIVQTYHHNLPQCINKIRQKSIRDQTQADVLLSTVHKAKGLEFPTVKVTDDFVDLKEFIERGAGLLNTGMAPRAIPVEEANLLYVAVTRAKHALIMSESIYALLTQIGGGGMSLVLSEQLKSQGVTFVCEDTKESFEPQALTLQKQEVTLSNKKVVKSCVYSPLSLVGNGSEYSHLMGDPTEQRSQDAQELPRQLPIVID